MAPGKKGIRPEIKEFKENVRRVMGEQTAAVNKYLGGFHQRLTNTESSMARLISTDAVALRLIFDKLEITAEDRFQAGMELDMFAELFALFHFFVSSTGSESPLIALREFDNIRTAQEGGSTDKPPAPDAPRIKPDKNIAVRVLFMDPREYHLASETTEEELEGFSLVIDTEGQCRLVDAVISADDDSNHIASDVIVAPSRFERLFTNHISAELAYMEGMISVSDAAGLGRFLQLIDFEEYVQKAQAKAAEVHRAKEVEARIHQEGRSEIDPTLLAAENKHPSGARVFGGDVGS